MLPAKKKTLIPVAEKAAENLDCIAECSKFVRLKLVQMRGEISDAPLAPLLKN